MGDIVRETGITQRNIVLLLEHYGDSVPSLMDGERRRYPPEAVPTIKRLWRQYNSGLTEGEVESNQWYEQALGALSSASSRLSEAAEILRSLETQLRTNTPRRVFYINTLPGSDLELANPIAVMVDETGPRVLARLDEAELEAEGKTTREAVMNLREVAVRTFVGLSQEAPLSSQDADQLATLSSLIRWTNTRKPGSAKQSPAGPGAERKRAAPSQQEVIATLWKNQGLSTRAANALGKAGLANLDQLRAARRETGLKLPNLGRASRAEVEAFLGEDAGARRP